MYRIANVLITAVLTVNAAAAVLPAGFNQSTITTSLSAATAMALAADGRIFVAQQNGALRIISDGALLAQPFVSLNVSSVGERGLLGVTLDPNFESNGFVYVYYTTAGAPIHNRVSRFTATGNVAAAGSEVVLLELDNLSGATNHNGGALHFGPDGKLYIATGENANGPNSQSLANMLGKILRINSNGTIPADNPFYSQSSGNNRAIWALGLRNPYRFTFQNGTGRMFINDVGQNSWEEINAGSRGANYGWPSTEGPTTDSRYTSPVLAYGHGTGPTVGCSITGGAFYNPAVARFPANYVGKYFFGDFCSGWIRVLDPATRTASGFATGAGYVVDLAVSSTGKLLILNRSSLVEVDWPSGGDGSSIWTAPTINEPSSLESPVTHGLKFRSDVGGYL
ncbi:MAG TPA: PQQ-dependent sugar dehydrogenase [Bryobacteraceae bacterium]|nr:PQQ-dependent sugar dehydrogenase [Bryobacteraceae bacterium]